MLAITIPRISTPATSMLILTRPRRVRGFQCRRFQRRRLSPIISMLELLDPSRLDAKNSFNSQRFNLVYVVLHEHFNSTRWRHLKWEDKHLRVLEITGIICWYCMFDVTNWYPFALDHVFYFYKTDNNFNHIILYSITEIMRQEKFRK